MKNTENTRKAGEDKENRRTGWQENALIKSFPIKTKKDLKEMRRRTEWRVDVDRCGSWGQSADLLISNTEKQKRTRYTDTQHTEKTNFRHQIISWTKTTHSLYYLHDALRCQNIPAIAQRIRIFHVCLSTHCDYKHSHNFRKWLKIFLIL